MMLAGLISAIALLLICFKVAGRKVIGHDVVFDVLITGALMMALAGTYSGMMAALFGGLIVSVFLLVLKKVTYSEQLKITSRKGQKIYYRLIPEVKFVRVYPRLKRK